MKQLRAMRRHVEIQAAFLQIVSLAFVCFVTESVTHLPSGTDELREAQRRVALGLMRCKVYDDQIKFVWFRLPLNENKILLRRISPPGFMWAKKFSFAAADR